MLPTAWVRFDPALSFGMSGKTGEVIRCGTGFPALPR